MSLPSLTNAISQPPTWNSVHDALRRSPNKMKKILIVDDNTDVRRLIRIALGKTFKIFEAEDGASALQIARDLYPDLIVLDIMMPGKMDGLQVLDAIRADPGLKVIRVVLVTAKGQASDAEIGMQRGADAYFVKPFSPLQLTAFIQETVDKGEMHV
jgi:CheY-like chemotaxis protein